MLGVDKKATDSATSSTSSTILSMVYFEYLCMCMCVCLCDTLRRNHQNGGSVRRAYDAFDDSNVSPSLSHSRRNTRHRRKRHHHAHRTCYFAQPDKADSSRIVSSDRLSHEEPRLACQWYCKEHTYQYWLKSSRSSNLCTSDNVDGGRSIRSIRFDVSSQCTDRSYE